jgi:4-hydroxy-2-oxoheptanedioate aldolase
MTNNLYPNLLLCSPAPLRLAQGKPFIFSLSTLHFLLPPLWYEFAMTFSLKSRWQAGEVLGCAWLGINHSFVVELFARQDFDCIALDMQHNMNESADLVGLLQAIELSNKPTLIRAASHDSAVLMKALDAGVHGVIVPLINTAEDAAKVVSACLYPPKGTRSYGPFRASYVFPDYVAKANDEIAIFAMIETTEGLKNLESICKTPGLTGIFIGPADLSYALGLAPKADNEDPKHLETVAHIVATCKKYHLVAGIYSDDPSYAKRAAAQGIQLIVIASDARLISNTAALKVAAFKNRENPASSKTGY